MDISLLTLICFYLHTYISLSSLQHAPLLQYLSSWYSQGGSLVRLLMQPLNILNIDFSATRVSRRHPTSHLHGGGCELILSVQWGGCSAKARMTAIVWRPSRKLASTMTGRRGKVSAALHLSARYVQIVHQCWLPHRPCRSENKTTAIASSKTPLHCTTLSLPTTAALTSLVHSHRFVALHTLDSSSSNTSESHT